MTRASKQRRRHGDDLRAAADLVVRATAGVTDVVRDVHLAIASGPAILGEPLALPARLWTKFAYTPVREVTRLVGSAVDRGLAELEPYLGESVPGPAREATLAALNGVLGDYLVAIESPLAIPMELKLAPASPIPQGARARGPRLLLMVHGSSMSEGQWTRQTKDGPHDHGAALARDLGYTAVYVRYNSGRHISDNGKDLARALDELVATWPELESITILGFSMGALVARSAIGLAEIQGLAWRGRLRQLVCLGAPHHGSPIERGGSLVDFVLEATKYSAPIARLAKIRSAGVTDMRFGNVRGNHRPLPLPTGVACYAIAASTSRSPTAKPLGDGLLPVDSALGRSSRPGFHLAFPEEHCWIAYRAVHLDLLGRADVYEQIRAWLALATA